VDAQTNVTATDEVPAVEREIAFDMVRRGLYIAPLVVLAAGLLRGWHGAASAGIAVGIVLVNFLIAAAIMTWAAKSGPNVIGAAALVGYVVRLAIVLAALLLLRHRSWIDLPTLGFVLLFTQLGLLFWEAKYLSISLAAPGLRPARPVTSGEK
jgi:hypothetical protein